MKKIIVLFCVTLLLPLSATETTKSLTQENLKAVEILVKKSINQEIKNYDLKKPLRWGLGSIAMASSIWSIDTTAQGRFRSLVSFHNKIKKNYFQNLRPKVKWSIIH